MTDLLRQLQEGHFWRTRGKLYDLPEEACTQPSNAAKAAEAISYFDHNHSLEKVRGLALDRFAYYIEPTKYDIENFQTLTNETIRRVRSPAATAIEQGYYELVVTGVGGRIVKAVSTLTSQPDQSIQFVDTAQETEEGAPMDAEDTGKLIDLLRERGQFKRAWAALDFISAGVEVSWMHVGMKGHNTFYDNVAPGNIWLVYGDKVVSHGEGLEDFERSPDTHDIDDAIAVIIRLKSSQRVDKESTYLAYVGGCEDEPDGRMVEYQAQEHWPIPGPDSANEKISEYEDKGTGKRCNPLTRMLNYGDKNQKRLVKTEYPIVQWRGGYRMIEDSASPLTTTLYETSLELELGWSRILQYALSNARGKDVFNKSDTDDRTSLPDNLEVIVNRSGSTYQKLFGGSAETQSAVEVLTKLSQQVSGGYHVPGYMVIEDGNVPESGYHLALRTQPLVDFRMHRYEMNDPNMTRIFDVERGLLGAYFWESVNKLLSPTIEQKWDPGTWQPPGDEFERIEGIQQREDAGYIGPTQAVQEANRLPTRADAEEKVEEIRKDGYSKTTDMFGNQSRKQPLSTPPVKQTDDEQDRSAP